MVSQTISFFGSSIVCRTRYRYHFVDESPAIVSERSTHMQVRPGRESPDRLNLDWILQVRHGRVAKLGGGPVGRASRHEVWHGLNLSHCIVIRIWICVS